jgi:signal transduction histidine kinase
MGEVMQAVAVLAHKINNPLTALLGRSQLLSHRAGDDPKIAKATKVIEESAIRISELIRELAKVAKYGGGDEMKTILARMNPEPPSAPEEKR